MPRILILLAVMVPLTLGCRDFGAALDECREEGRCKPCENTVSDPNNCGECGKVCPMPVNAVAVCVSGSCGRGICEPGFHDFDAAYTFGCEVKCEGRVCTDAAGARTTLTVEPIPERSVGSLASGAALGESVQTSSQYTNISVAGELTAHPSGGPALSASTAHRHLGSFVALESR